MRMKTVKRPPTRLRRRFNRIEFFFLTVAVPSDILFQSRLKNGFTIDMLKKKKKKKSRIYSL